MATKTNAELRAEIEELKAKLAEAQAGASGQKEDVIEDIPAGKMIRVMSLSDGGVNLSTEPGGHGRTFRLDRFGAQISITYGDLLACLSTSPKTFEDGTVMIMDPAVVKANYLDETYSHILGARIISGILDFTEYEIRHMVSSTTQTIQETIVSLIFKRLQAGESIDLNKLKAIGESCTPPKDLYKIAVDAHLI